MHYITLRLQRALTFLGGLLPRDWALSCDRMDAASRASSGFGVVSYAFLDTENVFAFFCPLSHPTALCNKPTFASPSLTPLGMPCLSNQENAYHSQIVSPLCDPSSCKHSKMQTFCSSYCTSALSKVLHHKIKNVFLVFWCLFFNILFVWKLLQPY